MKYSSLRSFLLAPPILLSTMACTSIDCPLDNQVAMVVKFYDASSQKSTNFSQTLSVYGLKNEIEELLFNQGQGLKEIQIPLNAASDTDTLLFKFSDGTNTTTERLVLQHARQQHFESLDCPSVTFHTLQSVTHKADKSTSLPVVIDHISIANPNVQYEDIEHLKVYLRTPTQQ